MTKFDSLTSSTPPRTGKLALARLPSIAESPLRMDLGGLRAEPSLLEERWDGVGGLSFDDESFEADRALGSSSPKRLPHTGKNVESPARVILDGKENLPA